MTGVASPRDEDLIRAAIARMRAGVMAIVFGMVGGVGLFLATAWLLLRGGGPRVGPTLGLLGVYLPGYSVSWPGAVIGLGYGVVLGGAAGWCVARVYNRVSLRLTAGRREAG